MAQRRRGQPHSFPQGSGQRPGGSPGQGNQRQVVVTASTGNAGAALAGMAAAAHHHAVVFAPKNAPSAKVAQIWYSVPGSSWWMAITTRRWICPGKPQRKAGWYCRNTGYNPFTAEGKKPRRWRFGAPWKPGTSAPSQAGRSMFVSVGDGNIISGIHKGFQDLKDMGWLDAMPRMFGIQSKGPRRSPTPFGPGAPRSNQLGRRPWRTASRWTCLPTACGPCGPRPPPVGRISPFPTSRSWGRFPLWGQRAYFPNLPPQPPTPA